MCGQKFPPSESNSSNRKGSTLLWQRLLPQPAAVGRQSLVIRANLPALTTAKNKIGLVSEGTYAVGFDWLLQTNLETLLFKEECRDLAQTPVW